MTKKEEYRNNGAIGVLLDEYENAINNLILTINNLNSNQLQSLIDCETEDQDCKSIQAILTHVLESGYTYVIEIKKWLGEEIDYRTKETFNSVEEYDLAMVKMFEFTETFFNDHPNLKLTELDLNHKIKVRWGQIYDVEQLMQHAIVHVLRHRRQIEIFKQQFNN